MSLTSKNQLLIAFKKLLGKAHTNSQFGVANETVGSNVQIDNSTVFSQPIPSSPSSSLYSITNNIVEKVQFSLVSIAPSQYTAGGTVAGGITADGDGSSTGAFTNGIHAFALTLPSNYTTLSSSPKKGTGIFLNNQSLTASNGALQIIPERYGSLYLADISSSSGIIAPLAQEDYLLDPYSGILFIQDIERVPTSVTAYLYIGDYLTQRVSSSLGQFTNLTASVVSASSYVGIPPTTPGGTNTSIQFNSGSTFSGSSNLNYNFTTNTLSGTTAQFTTVSASNLSVSGGNVVFYEAAVLGDNAYVLYNSSIDKLAAFPGLYVTGAITASTVMSSPTGIFTTLTGSTVTGSTAQFTTITGSTIVSTTELPSFIAINTSSNNTHRLLINQSSQANNGLRITGQGSTIDLYGTTSNTAIIGITGDYSIGHQVGTTRDGNITVGRSLVFTTQDNASLGGFLFSRSGTVVSQITRAGDIYAVGNITGSLISGSTAEFTTVTGSTITGSTALFPTISGTNINISGRLDLSGSTASTSIIDSNRAYLFGHENFIAYNGTLRAGRTLTLSAFTSIVNSISSVTLTTITNNGELILSGSNNSLTHSRLRFLNTGSSEYPLITQLNDTNTGIYFPDADTICLSTSGSERVRINNNGDTIVSGNLIVTGSTTLSTVSGTTAQFTTVTGNILRTNGLGVGADYTTNGANVAAFSAEDPIVTMNMGVTGPAVGNLKWYYGSAHYMSVGYPGSDTTTGIGVPVTLTTEQINVYSPKNITLHNGYGLASGAGAGMLINFSGSNYFTWRGAPNIDALYTDQSRMTYIGNLRLGSAISETANARLDISGSAIISGNLNVTGYITGAAIFLATQGFPGVGSGSSTERANIAASSSLFTTGAITAGIYGNGSPIHPTYNFSVQPSTGMYYHNNNELGLAIAGVQAARISRGSGYAKLAINGVASPDGLIHAILTTASADLARIILENNGAGNTNLSYDLSGVQGLNSRFIQVPHNASGFGEWTRGAVIHASGSTVLSNDSNLHYSAVTHKWYGNAGSGSADRIMTLNSSGNLGIGNSTPNARLDVNGNTIISGNLTVTGSITELSTRRIKTNIQTINNELNNLYKLNPVSYVRLDDGRKEYGFISEEVKEIYPEFVVGEGINYPKMVSVLVSAVKELTNKVQQQQTEIELIKNRGI